MGGDGFPERLRCCGRGISSPWCRTWNQWCSPAGAYLVRLAGTLQQGWGVSAPAIGSSPSPSTVNGRGPVQAAGTDINLLTGTRTQVGYGRCDAFLVPARADSGAAVFTLPPATRGLATTGHHRTGRRRTPRVTGPKWTPPAGSAEPMSQFGSALSTEPHRFSAVCSSADCK